MSRAAEGSWASCLMVGEGVGRQGKGRVGLITPEERVRIAMAER